MAEFVDIYGDRAPFKVPERLEDIQLGDLLEPTAVQLFRQSRGTKIDLLNGLTSHEIDTVLICIEDNIREAAKVMVTESEWSSGSSSKSQGSVTKVGSFANYQLVTLVMPLLCALMQSPNCSNAANLFAQLSMDLLFDSELLPSAMNEAVIVNETNRIVLEVWQVAPSIIVRLKENMGAEEEPSLDDIFASVPRQLKLHTNVILQVLDCIRQAIPPPVGMNQNSTFEQRIGMVAQVLGWQYTWLARTSAYAVGVSLLHVLESIAKSINTIQCLYVTATDSTVASDEQAVSLRKLHQLVNGFFSTLRVCCLTMHNKPNANMKLSESKLCNLRQHELTQPGISDYYLLDVETMESTLPPFVSAAVDMVVSADHHSSESKRRDDTSSIQPKQHHIGKLLAELLTKIQGMALHHKICKLIPLFGTVTQQLVMLSAAFKPSLMNEFEHMTSTDFLKECSFMLCIPEGMLLQAQRDKMKLSLKNDVALFGKYDAGFWNKLIHGAAAPAVTASSSSTSSTSLSAVAKASKKCVKKKIGKKKVPKSKKAPVVEADVTAVDDAETNNEPATKHRKRKSDSTSVKSAKKSKRTDDYDDCHDNRVDDVNNDNQVESAASSRIVTRTTRSAAAAVMAAIRKTKVKKVTKKGSRKTKSSKCL